MIVMLYEYVQHVIAITYLRKVLINEQLELMRAYFTLHFYA